MRFFHLSDLHIGLKLINKDLREDQEYILGQIAKLAGQEQPDAVVIAGDIYDKAVPSAEAVELFDRFVLELTQAAPKARLMMISGNHDSAQRVNLFRRVLERHQVHMIGLPPLRPEEHIERVTLEDAYGRVHFYLLPFVKPSMIRLIVGQDKNGNNLSYDEALRRLIGREEINRGERNVLVSHQFYYPAGVDPERVERMDSEIRTVGDIDGVCADVLEPFDYAALGHIHKPMQVGRSTVRYCGTPLACSVSEAGQEKGVVLVELEEKGTVRTRVLPLHPLRRMRVVEGELEQVLSRGSDDLVSVILTDRADLDVIDMQDRLRSAFPNLLEIRRLGSRGADYTARFHPVQQLDPLKLCISFLGEVSEEERALLSEALNSALEVEE